MAKLKCTNILPFIPLLADSAPSAAESDRLKKHLSVCPACRREFDLYRTMKQTTASLSSPSLSSDFHEKLMKTIKEATTQSKRTNILRPHLRRKTMGYVATAAVAAVVALSVVTQSQVSFFGTPDAFPSDNLDNFVTPQVVQPQGAEPQVTQSQGAQPQVATPSADEPTHRIGDQTAPRQDAPAQVTESREAAEPQGTAPAASCGIVAEEPQQTFATYRVFIKTAYLPEAQKLLADCPLDEHGYRADSGAAPLLEALSALPGYRTECIQNDTTQPLTADYICLIGE